MKCRAVLGNALKDSNHTLNARHTYFVKEVILLEALLTLFRGQLTPIQQLATNKGTVLRRKLVHKFSRFQIGEFRGGSIHFAPPAMP